MGPFRISKTKVDINHLKARNTLIALALAIVLSKKTKGNGSELNSIKHFNQRCVTDNIEA